MKPPICADATTSKAVPQAYRGVWQRTLYQSASGERDTSTRVLWAQSARFHVDLRQPADLPSGPSAAGSASDLDYALALTRQAGFAGHTRVDDSRCQWHRKIDFRPPDGTLDIGLMHFSQPDFLIERCPDGRYVEHWVRLPDSLGAIFGLALESIESRNPRRLARLIVCGHHFAFAASRGWDLPLAADLTALVREAEPAARRALLDCEISFGTIDQSGGTISASTLPHRVGATLLPEAGDLMTSLSQLVAGNVLGLGGAAVPQQWRVTDTDMSDQWQRN